MGNTSSLSYPANAISGPNNPANNFFASQINTTLALVTDPLTGKLVNNGSSTIDTRGSFGTINSNGVTGTAVSGARQGYDIAAIDITGLIGQYAHGNEPSHHMAYLCIGSANSGISSTD